MKRILALVLDLVMPSALASGCAPIGESGGGQSSPAVNTGSNTSYTVATNNFDAGVYPFNANTAYEQNATDALGMTLNVTDNKFTADKSITQLQNRLTFTPDGMVFLGISETLFPATAQYCENTKTPYVFFAYVPKNEDVATFKQDERYVRTVVHSLQDEEADVTGLTLADGCKTAVVSADASSGYAHDHRIIGFTEAFEAGGGEVLFVSHSADPPEGVQETNDLLTAYPDVDCVYTCGDDYVMPAVDVVKSRDLEGCKIYGADINPNVCQLIMDGEVEACSGDVSTSCGVTITLLINYLDENVIKDSEGKVPYFDSLELFTMTSDNAEGFYKFLSDGALSTHAISGEEYQNLLVRNGTEANYDYYVDFMANYAENVCAKVEANANGA